jgi:hypothetical protein
MFWGEGSALGLLTFLGYSVLLLGAALMWRSRNDVSFWIQEEVGTARRSFSRYTVVGPFYRPREESRIKEVPNFFSGFCGRALRRMSHIPATGGVILIFLGSLLVLLDFFI